MNLLLKYPYLRASMLNLSVARLAQAGGKANKKNILVGFGSRIVDFFATARPSDACLVEIFPVEKSFAVPGGAVVPGRHPGRVPVQPGVES